MPSDELVLASQYRSAFGSPGGVKVLADLRRYCRANTCCYVAGDSHGTAFLEGARSVFLHIESELLRGLDGPQDTEALTEGDENVGN